MLAHIVTAANRAAYAPVLDEMFRQRRAASPGSEARDTFDTDDAVYILVINDVGDLEASLRLIPSWAPNPVRSLAPSWAFPEPPADPRVWEWSRFRPGRPGASPDRIAESRGVLIAGVLEFALSRRIAGFIGCCDAKCLNGFQELGWKTRFLSDRIDEEDRAAISWQVDERSLARVRRLFGLTRPVSIEAPHQPAARPLHHLHFAAISEIWQIEDPRRVASALMAISYYSLRTPASDDRRAPPREPAQAGER